MGSGKFCKSCGSKLDEDSQFCTECGQRIDKENKEQVIKQTEQPGNQGQYIPYSYNQSNYSNSAPVKKKNNSALIIGIVAGVVLLAALVFLALKFMGGKPSQTTNVQVSKAESKVESKSESKIESKPEVKKIDISNPMLFLPKLYMRYTFEKTDSSGKTEKVNVVSGRATDFVLLSLVEYPEGADTNVENRFAYRANHIKKEKNAFVVFSDEQFSYFGKEYIIGKHTKWLPEKIEVGASWKDDLAAHKVIEAGVDCDLGFEKLSNCVVIESQSSTGTEVNYIAPDYGVVMIKNKDNGKVVYKLTGAKSMNKDEANKIVGHFSIAMSTFIEKYYNK